MRKKDRQTDRQTKKEKENLHVQDKIQKNLISTVRIQNTTTIPEIPKFRVIVYIDLDIQTNE